MSKSEFKNNDNMILITLYPVEKKLSHTNTVTLLMINKYWQLKDDYCEQPLIM